MKTRLSKALAALFLLAVAGGAAALFLQYRQFSRRMISAVNSTAARKLGREVRFSKISFSPLQGVVIDDACVSRRPSFKAGEFFCARRIIVRPELRALLRHRTYFSQVSLTDPVIRLRENAGRWDFEDLTDMLAKSPRGIYLTWNAREVALKNARLYVTMGALGREFALENTDIELLHYSSYGGNYTASAKGLLKSSAGGKLLSSRVSLNASANFEYAGLSSLSGSFEAADASYGAITLSALRASCELFNMRRDAGQRNYTARLEAQELFIPQGENPAGKTLDEAMKIFSAVTGKPAPRLDDLEAGKVEAAFSLKGSSIAIGAEITSNFLKLKADLIFNGPERSTKSGLEARMGKGDVKLTASGPLARPEITPALSVTLHRKVAGALKNLGEPLLNYFQPRAGG